MNTKVSIYIISTCIIALLAGCGKAPTGAEAFPAYTNEITPRIIDASGVGLTSREQGQLAELATSVAEMLYNVDDSYDPQNVGVYIEEAETEELKTQAKMYSVSSAVKKVQVLDIKVNGGNSVNILACLTLDYESKNKVAGEYLFMLDIAAERTDDNWICTEVASKGSATTDKASLTRDDVTGNVKFAFDVGI